MKSIHVLLEEIKVKDHVLYEAIIAEIHKHAKSIGVQTADTTGDTEHPVDPPHHP